MGKEAKDIKLILSEAMEKDTTEERAAYLDVACEDNASLRNEVESLLGLEKKVGDFLEVPALCPGYALGDSPVAEGPGTVIGRYKLLEKIGEGGMAVVYMAEQQEPIRRKVALKIIKLGMDTRQVIARFEAERQALAMMDHPNIAKVLDAGATETGRPFFVMELVTGVSITEYCDKNNLNTKDRLALFLQVCNAVQHAHQKGIIHRDIKPSNVMVTHHDGRPVPKVIDFGIAKATNQRLTEKTLFTRYAHIIGTPAYMSPEQADLSDLGIDTRTDIYSLGVLLYELLTGTTPFSEEELRKAGYTEMQRIIQDQEPAKPSTKLSTLGETLTDVAKHRSSTPDLLRKAVRGDLDWIVMKSLEKDRVRRYDTASGLALDIQRHLEHEPVLARGPSSVYRLHKFLRRHRVQVIAALGIAVVACAGIVILSMWSRDRLQLTEAEGFKHRGILSQAREQYARAEREAALETIKPIMGSRHVGLEAQLLYAGILVDNRRSDEAVTILGSLLNDRPEIAGAAHSLLARILWESESPNAERVKEIEEHRQKAEALLPETAEAYFLRAMTAITVKEQLASLDRALQLDPGHYESRRLRAYTHYASRKYDRMKEDALVMEVLRPRDSLGYSLRAMAWRELGRYPEAITDYDSALELTPKDNPEYVDLSAQRCESLLRMGQYQRVIADAESCLKLRPDHAVFQYHVFCALTALGDFDRADAMFQEIVRSSPTARNEFWFWVTKYIFDTLEAGRSWHPPDRKPRGAAFLPLVEAEETYRCLSAKGHRVVTNGFSAQWSPNGKKLAFSLGVQGYSGVALYDLATKETELLIVPGKDPRWSPDGRYLAFVRDCQALRLEELTATERKDQERWLTDEEVWIMKADGTEPRRLARGGWPSWSKDSTHVYYHSRLEKMLCSIPIAGSNVESTRIMSCPSEFPSVSPDNQQVAYLESSSLKVRDLISQALLTQWRVPFGAWAGPAWSPMGKELCLGAAGSVGDRTGLWIYSFDGNEPAKVLSSQIMAASWTPDGTRLVFGLRPPYLELWVADLDPDVPTTEALGPGQTLDEHWQDMLHLYTRRIEMDPQDTYVYSDRARYYEYLREQTNVNADMNRWSAVMSGRSASGVDASPVHADFTFGTPASLGLPVNSPGTDCCPCISADGLELYFQREEPDGQIYVARRPTAGSAWGEPVKLGPAINTSDYEGGPSISFDGLSLYFGRASGGLFVTRRPTVKDDWGTPVSLGPTVNSGLTFGACVSADELELYFHSNRPGGYGGATDIWATTRATVNDAWGTPVNLGPLINSPYMDNWPGITPDGLVLFFSSDRPGGHGSRDVYMARRAKPKDPWGPLVNLGSVINFALQTVHAKVSSDGSTLYFCPFGVGGSADIWQASIIPIVDFDGNREVEGKEG